MAIRILPYHISAFGISDIGLVRPNNEDFWAEIPKINFFVLADGMGGHRAGEIAAQQAVNHLCDLVKEAFTGNTFTVEESKGIIQFAIEQTNEIVYKLSQQYEAWHGMGTTICCLYFHPKGVIIGHVGDSRIYRLRGQEFVQLTKDHSLLREMLDTGKITEHETPDFAYKNIITKAIGTEAALEPSVYSSEVLPSDIYLMCSDGLSDMLKPDEMKEIVQKSPDIKHAGYSLVEKAKSKGGFDNVTIILLQVDNQKKETKVNLPKSSS